MTITRLASAGRKGVIRIAAASVALASVTALAVAGVAEPALATAFTFRRFTGRVRMPRWPAGRCWPAG